MLAIGKALLAVVAIGAALIWIIAALPPLPKAEVAETQGEALAASVAAATEEGPATLEGIVIYDQGPVPPVPYIQYPWEDGVRTKQLIYREARSCSPAAGDLPCAFDDGRGSAPELPYGSRIRVTGVIEGDQILVEDVEML